MIKKYFLQFFLCLITYFNCFSKEATNPVIDTIAHNIESKRNVSLDIANRYVWRGQSYGGNTIVIQPALNYAITKKLTVGFWATTNFKNNYYFLDGSFINWLPRNRFKHDL